MVLRADKDGSLVLIRDRRVQRDSKKTVKMSDLHFIIITTIMRSSRLARGLRKKSSNIYRDDAQVMRLLEIKGKPGESNLE